MKCPNCEDLQESKVIDSRATIHNIRRRRECLVCGTRWTTREVDDVFLNELTEAPKRERAKQIDPVTETLALCIEALKAIE